MSHEYRGTTCLQSNVVNPESNAPPGISIHCFLTGLSLPGGVQRLTTTTSLGWVSKGRPLETSVSSEENTFFMSSHKKTTFFGVHSGASLFQFAVWPVSHTFPRCRNYFLFFVQIYLFAFKQVHIRNKRKPKSYSFFSLLSQEQWYYYSFQVILLSEDKKREKTNWTIYLPV